jgi:hypothetical protein
LTGSVDDVLKQEASRIALIDRVANETSSNKTVLKSIASLYRNGDSASVHVLNRSRNEKFYSTSTIRTVLKSPFDYPYEIVRRCEVMHSRSLSPPARVGDVAAREKWTFD